MGTVTLGLKCLNCRLLKRSWNLLPRAAGSRWPSISLRPLAVLKFPLAVVCLPIAVLFNPLAVVKLPPKRRGPWPVSPWQCYPHSVEAAPPARNAAFFGYHTIRLPAPSDPETASANLRLGHEPVDVREVKMHQQGLSVLLLAATQIPARQSRWAPNSCPRAPGGPTSGFRSILVHLWLQPVPPTQEGRDTLLRVPRHLV